MPGVTTMLLLALPVVPTKVLWTLHVVTTKLLWALPEVTTGVLCALPVVATDAFCSASHYRLSMYVVSVQGVFPLLTDCFPSPVYTSITSDTAAEAGGVTLGDGRGRGWRGTEAPPSVSSRNHQLKASATERERQSESAWRVCVWQRMVLEWPLVDNWVTTGQEADHSTVTVVEYRDKSATLPQHPSNVARFHYPESLPQPGSMLQPAHGQPSPARCTIRTSQQTRDVQPMLVQCWASVEDDGPTS